MWRRAWIILLVVVALVGAAVGAALMQTPKYDGSIKMLVGQEPGVAQAQGQNPLDAFNLQQITLTLTEAANSSTVAEEVIRQLDLQMTPAEFSENLKVEQIKATQLIEITYRDTDPNRAQQIVNTVGDVFSEKASEAGTTANALSATVWERSQVPDSPAAPNLILYIGLALMMGSFLGVSLALLVDYLDDSWRSPEEAEQISGVPTLAVVPAFEASKVKKGR
jgi:capsular polysaccharide biosynthesis protein